jgi:hypothetical protein
MRHRQTPTSLTDWDAPRELHGHQVETDKHGERVPQFLKVLIRPAYIYGALLNLKSLRPFGVNSQVADLKWTVLLQRSRVDIDRPSRWTS